MATTVPGLINATYDAASGTVQGMLAQDTIPRKIASMVIKGPARSTFRMYRGGTIADANQLTSTPTGGGGDNSYDSLTEGAPITIPAATDVLGVWSGGDTGPGQTGTCTLQMVVG